MRSLALAIKKGALSVILFVIHNGNARPVDKLKAYGLATNSS